VASSTDPVRLTGGKAVETDDMRLRTVADKWWCAPGHSETLVEPRGGANQQYPTQSFAGGLKGTRVAVRIMQKVEMRALRFSLANSSYSKPLILKQ